MRSRVKWQRDDVNLKDYESVPPNTRYISHIVSTIRLISQVARVGSVGR